jgi:hypothetical protein
MAVEAVDDAQAVRPQQIVLNLKWTEDGQQRQEMFGPWAQGDPETEEGHVAHMMAAHAFLGEWCRVTGLVPDKAAVIVVLDPGGWVRERLVQAETGRLMVAAGVVSAEELRKGSDDG